MKKTIIVFKYLLEFCVPLILSIAVWDLASDSWDASDLLGIQILFFIILLSEWIRRFLNEKQEGKFDNYYWMIITFIAFYFFMDILMLYTS